MKKLINLCFSAFTLFILLGCQGSKSFDEILVANDYVKNTSIYQKQGAAVSLVNSQVNIASSGVQYSIDLMIDSKYNSGEMRVKVNASDGLYITNGSTEITQNLTKGNIPLSYVVTATEEGRYYIYANVEVEINDKKSFRSLTLIVQVGSTNLNKALVDQNASKKIELEGNVESIVPMKADEKIIR